MPYEVVKRVGDRAYRYEVTRHRDPESGKAKDTWRYLGRVAPAIAQPHVSARPTRERFLDAFEALLSSNAFDAITVESISERAQLAPATFYRHFKNKVEILTASVLRVRERLRVPEFHAPSDRAAERLRIRRFLRDTLTNSAVANGLIRAVFEMRAKDERIRALHEARTREVRDQFAAYITGLQRANLGHDDDPERLADVLVVMLQAMMHENMLRKQTPADPQIAVIANAVERMLFR